MYYFISYTQSCPKHTIFLKNNHRSLISQLSSRTVFSDLALWRHHSWSVTSREQDILALARRQSSLVITTANIDFSSPGIHGLACKKRWFHDHLIFITEIHIPGKNTFIWGGALVMPTTGNWVINGSWIGFSPVWHQDITQTIADFFFISGLQEQT